MHNGYGRLKIQHDEGASSSVQPQTLTVESSTRIPDDVSLYQFLKSRGLLEENWLVKGFGVHLIPDGELGYGRYGTRARFFAPGYWTFFDTRKKYHGKVSISELQDRDEPIRCVNFQLITIKDGEIGLSLRDNQVIILQPGRHLLEKPHEFKQKVRSNQHYINLQNFHRIIVPTNMVAVAYENGEAVIIPETKPDEPYISNSPTFEFNSVTGFKSIKEEVVELKEFKVHTNNAVEITVTGLINYRIKNTPEDLRKAFTAVEDVHEAVRKQAITTLTSIFLNASIDQIAPNTPIDVLSEGKLKEKKVLDELQDVNEKFTKTVYAQFRRDFGEIAQRWGVELEGLHIEKLKFSAHIVEILEQRMRDRLEAENERMLVHARNNTKVDAAHGDLEAAKKRAEADYVIQARAADARVYEAEKSREAGETLAQSEVAVRLRVLELQNQGLREMAAGDGKVVYMPHSANMNGFGDLSSQASFWASPPKVLTQQPEQRQLVRPRSSSLSK